MTTPSQSQSREPAQEARALLEQGLSASREGRAEEARAYFEQALVREPAWPLLHFLLGSEDAAATDYVRAEARFAQAVLLAPDFHLARYQLGLLQFSGGRPEIALLTWGPLESLPADQLPFPSLLQAFRELHQGRSSEARAHFEAALPLAASNAGLAADIQRILDALSAQFAEPEMAGQMQAPAAGDHAVQHVLLANYARGTLH